MRRMVIAVVVLGLVTGCQKRTEQREPAQSTDATATEATPEPKGPPMRPSDARIKVDSPTLAAGETGSFGVHYYGVEPVKALVIPLRVPAGMYLDSVSFAGSMVEYLANKPVKINNEEHTLLMGAVPVTEPKIPAEEGLLATVYFTLASDAVSGRIEETFAPPANYLSYVDTANTLVQPYYEAGELTVQR